MKYILTITATVLIIVAVLWPGSQIPHTKWPVDKLVHFTMFTCWTTAFMHDLHPKWVKALIAGLLFAAFTEVIQLTTKERTFDLNDLLADTAGILFAMANFSWLDRIIRKILRR